MECNYKTLVLVDDSLSIGPGNREIVKEVLIYLFEHAEEGDAFALAFFGETIDYATDYETDRQSLMKALDAFILTDQDTYLTDVLMDILQEWRQADFACRSILLITDGLSEESLVYPVEELYFTLDKTEYPIYVIGCVQKNNGSALKDLAAISRISGGQAFYTEFADSEAEVERKIGDELLAAMRERQITFPTQETIVKKERESVKLVPAVELQETIVSENKVLLSENEDIEPVLYELAPSLTAGQNAGYLTITLGVIAVLAVLFAAGCMWMKKNKIRRENEKEFMENLQTEVKRRSSCLIDVEKSYGVTQALFRDEASAEDGNATRLLFQQAGLRDIILEDRSDPTKLFRASCKDKLILGRGKNRCDIVIDYDDSVSGQHCELYLRGGQWVVRDLQSSNGTQVNDQKVYQEMELYSGDILKMGQLEFQVRMPS